MSSQSSQFPSPYSPGPKPLLLIPQCSLRQTHQQINRQTDRYPPSPYVPTAREQRQYTHRPQQTQAQLSWTTHRGPSQSTRWDLGQHHHSSSTFGFDVFRARIQVWCEYIARHQLQILSPRVEHGEGIHLHSCLNSEAMLLSLQLKMTIHNWRNQVSLQVTSTEIRSLPKTSRATTLQTYTVTAPCQSNSLPTYKNLHQTNVYQMSQFPYLLGPIWSLSK